MDGLILRKNDGLVNPRSPQDAVLSTGQSNMKIKILSFLVFAVFQGLTKTFRTRVVGTDYYQEAINGRKTVIYAAPHGRMLGLIAYTRGRPIAMLASKSYDGSIIANVLRWLGFDVVRGSSSKGGARGIIELIRRLKDGSEAAVTVDGPRGPQWHVKPGIVQIAAKSGALILPMTFSCKRAHVFHKSWDRFVLPFPFSCLSIAYGAPIAVDRSAGKEDIEAICQQIKMVLKQETDRLDDLYRV